jgi:Rho-binding antiterminator
MTKYLPISCDLHDVLEAAATTRGWVQVTFLDEDGSQQQRNTRLIDVFSRDAAEYLLMATGEIVRLDRLVTVSRATA